MKKSIGVIVLILGLLLCTAVNASENVEFTQTDFYYSEQPLTTLPMTFEAEIFFEAGLPTSLRGGAIWGNFANSESSCVNFEIGGAGHPRLYVIDADGVKYDHTFYKINVYNGKWTHIAIVNDVENLELRCYVDGVLKEKITATALPTTISSTRKVVLGGDQRKANAQYFKGKIRKFAIYSDVRTAEEIASDAVAEEFDTNSAISCYNVANDENGKAPEMIYDLVGGNDFDRYRLYLENEPKLDDYAYSFAVVGDTQIVNIDSPEDFHSIYDYIIENAGKYNTKFVFGMGDITDEDKAYEWALAKSHITRLDNVVPYSVIRGNHDGTANFQKFFTAEEYADKIGGCYNNSMLNSYQTLQVGNIKYLIFALDLGPSDAVLEWAGDIIEAHPDYNVIITTHGYLNSDGTLISEETSTMPPTKYGGVNNGDDMWEKLISKHSNIVLVLCGHISSGKVKLSQLEGDNGNTVSQLLINHQGYDTNWGGIGVVAMLYFSEDGKNVQVRAYSTIEEKYFLEENVYSFELDVVESDDTPIEVPEMTLNGISFNVNLSANQYDGNVIAVLYDENGQMIDFDLREADENVKVTFGSAEIGHSVKVMWWDGMDTMVPVCNYDILDIN